MLAPEISISSNDGAGSLDIFARVNTLPVSLLVKLNFEVVYVISVILLLLITGGVVSAAVVSFTYSITADKPVTLADILGAKFPLTCNKVSVNVKSLIVYGNIL